MIFNVITPLARFQNINDLVNHLEPKNIKWHVITDEDSNETFDVKKDWVFHHICPNSGVNFWERCHNSINWFIENKIVNEDEYYCVLNDDDGYEDNLFDKLKTAVFMTDSENKFNDLIITSMMRGHNIPSDAIPVRRHPTHPLYAHPSYMQVGGVGLEQFFAKGKILKKHKIPLTTCGDGEFITNLVKTYGALYQPEINVWFNYFEPGRWNK